MSKFTYIELFSGVGGFRQALDPLGGECVFASEIDPFATKAYKALYNGAAELHGDITKIDAHDIPDHDVLVGGFPCQSFSVAGQRRGFEEARGTLFFEIARIASAKQPRLMLLENVKGLLSHDGGNTFETMCAVLNDIGYAIDFRVLNSKHYGVPQNRERIFVACDRDAEHAEWDIGGNGVEAKAKRRAQDLGIRTFNFDWPTSDTVTTRLRDVLEAQVDEKYYLSEEKTAKLIAQLTEKGMSVDDATIDMKSETSKTRGGMFKDGYVGALDHNCNVAAVVPIIAGSLDHYGNDQMNRVYSVDGVAPTITVVSGGGREQKIAEPVIEKVGHLPSDSGQTGAVYNADGIAPTCLNQHGNAVTKVAELQQYTDGSGDIGKGRRTHVMEGVDYVGSVTGEDRYMQVYGVLNPNGQCQTLTTNGGGNREPKVLIDHPRYRIRKLTPLECWRLQGFSDAAYATAKFHSEEDSLAIMAEAKRKGKRDIPDEVRAERLSDSQLYKQAGNAVTVNVISAIGKRLIPLLNETKSEVYV